MPLVILAWWPFRTKPATVAAAAPATTEPEVKGAAPKAGAKLEFDGARTIQRYRDRDHGHASFEELQLCFVNRGEEGAHVVAAMGLRAALAVWQQGAVMVDQPAAQWIVSPADDMTTKIGMADTVDVEPDGPVARLLVAYKWPGEKLAYVYAKDNEAAPGSRPTLRALSPGDYDLTAMLANDTEENSFTFRFTNPGIMGRLSVAGPLRVVHKDLKK